MTTAADPVRDAFRHRALAAVERIAREAPEEILMAALAAPTDTLTDAHDQPRRLSKRRGRLVNGRR